MGDQDSSFDCNTSTDGMYASDYFLAYVWHKFTDVPPRGSHMCHMPVEAFATRIKNGIKRSK